MSMTHSGAEWQDYYVGYSLPAAPVPGKAHPPAPPRPLRDPSATHPPPVTPAKAGVQCRLGALDSRFRGNDANRTGL
jgi:hypothetical protein